MSENKEELQMEEDRAPMVIVLMTMALSGAIVGGIFTGISIWLLTH